MMEKLCSVCGIIFTHFLFLVVEAAFVVSMYTACKDKDISCLVIAGLCRVAKQCLIPMWDNEKRLFKEVFNDGGEECGYEDSEEERNDES